MEMKRDEVLKNLAEVCRVYKGTLNDHEYLQRCLKWLEEQISHEFTSESENKVEKTDDRN